MDSIAAAHSGHMGLPLGAAEIGAVLYGSQVGVKRSYFTDQALPLTFL
jgi:transketolase